MLAAMAFPARYHYLSQIGALSPMPLNARLNVDARPPRLWVLNKMISHTTSALRKSNSSKAAVSRKNKNSKAPTKAGKLPEWDLSDLYAGIDAPEVARDLSKVDADCVAFETDYKGRLAEHTSREDG
ncbi:MAG: hypothetical protein JO283_20785, partial [Bradyrhizobium sp.]|nr:hypothetical protein [Bradyrhizobium sp.]